MWTRMLKAKMWLLEVPSEHPGSIWDPRGIWLCATEWARDPSLWHRGCSQSVVALWEFGNNPENLAVGAHSMTFVKLIAYSGCSFPPSQASVSLWLTKLKRTAWKFIVCPQDPQSCILLVPNTTGENYANTKTVQSNKEVTGQVRTEKSLRHPFFLTIFSDVRHPWRVPQYATSEYASWAYGIFWAKGHWDQQMQGKLKTQDIKFSFGTGNLHLQRKSPFVGILDSSYQQRNQLLNLLDKLYYKQKPSLTIIFLVFPDLVSLSQKPQTPFPFFSLRRCVKPKF